MICKICKLEFDTNRKALKHIRSHNIDDKTYYDTYIKKPNEDICPTCGNINGFLSIILGYRKHCCVRCATTDPNVYNSFRDNNPQKDTKIREKTKQTCLNKFGTEHAIASDKVKEKIKLSNREKYGVDWPFQSKEILEKTQQSCMDHFGVSNPMYSKEIQKRVSDTRQTNIQNLVKEIEQNNDTTLLLASDFVNKYGQGWLHAKDLIDVKIIKVGMYSFITKEDGLKIEKYYKHHFDGHKSYFEYNITNFVQSIYSDNILINKRTIIKPYELDIYIPKLKLAIETNGVWTHSQEAGCPNNYHLIKSLLCKEKGIRLIHIYEFEDLNKQKQLLKDLILGIDNYPKNDFNKNNLNNNIPKPEIIYKDTKQTVYGAGKLL